MEKFIVSARKYRPQDFKSVVGQEHITTTLKNAINQNQLAHAFLFCGPRGVGKTTCARILAKTINCENRTSEGEACNTCTSCTTFNKGTSLNIHELDAASNNSVEDIRTLVEQVRFSPQGGKYKVYIVDEVHMLSTAAFNAFLKTLEEPPPFALFILATTEKHKIIPTILSRCQIFDFKRITIKDTVHHLQEICSKESIDADKNALHLVAVKSEGCLRDALSILDKIVSFTGGKVTYANTLEHLNILDEDYYFQLLDAMQGQLTSDALLLYDTINRKGFEGDLVLNGFAEFIRNLMVSKDPKCATLLEVTEDFKKRYAAAAKKVETSWLVSALNILNESEINYRQARNKKLHVELALIKLCYLSQALDLSENGDGSKKKINKSGSSILFRAVTGVSVSPAERNDAAKTIATNPKVVRTEGAALFIEKGAMKKTRPPADAVAAVATVETKPSPSQKMEKVENVQTSTISANPVRIPQLGSLKEFREKIAKQQKSAQCLELEDAEMQIAWEQYIQKLEKENNSYAIGCFKNARLVIGESNCIEIITDSALKQRFIESERAELITHLQHHFNNRMITFQVSIDESNIVLEPKQESLSSKEQYVRMVEKYPVIQELKRRLRLQLD